MKDLLKVDRLKVYKFRTIQTPVELIFSNLRNIVVGENGTGKSTLLEIVSAIATGQFSQFSREPFHFKYSISNFSITQGTLQLEIKSAPYDYPSGELDTKLCEITVTGTLSGTSFEHDISFSSSPEEAVLTIETSEHKIPTFSFGRLTLNQWLVASIARALNAQYGLHALTEALDENPAAKQAIRNFLLLPNIIRLTEDSLPYRLLLSKSTPERVGDGIWLQVAELPSGNSLDDFKSSPIVLSWNIEKPVRDQVDAGRVRAIELDASSVRPLHRFVELTTFRDASVEIPLIEKDENALRFGSPRFYFHLPGGKIWNHDMLSYGQRRLFGMLMYFDASPGTVIVDELSNGLHYSWIAKCLEWTSHRQTFLTSQNPLLLDCLEFGDAEDVRNTFIVCRHEANEHGQVSWRRLSEQESVSFFRSLTVGIQNVSEVMRTHGLW